MTVVISSSFVLSPNTDNLDLNSPIVGYDNLVTSSNVAATTEDPDWPASNLGNPSTYLKWRSAAGSPTSEEFLTVTLDSLNDVDYLAIARHNFGTGIMAVTVQGLTESGSPTDWFDLVTERYLPNDNPAIFRFTRQPLFGIRLKIQSSQAATPVAPYLAVMYVGQLLLLQRRIYVGHTPQPYGRRLTLANHRSIAGDFLGRVVLSEKTETTVEMKNLTPGWYRSYMEPFLVAAKEIPFFFNWRPGDYPYESSYAWLANDAIPSNQQGNGMMQVSLDLEGIVT